MTKRVLTARHVVLAPTIETRALPKGVCGRLTGVALVYGVVDAYDTVFRRGCMDRTKREKVPAGKVPLFMDHSYGVRSHVGVLRTLVTQGDQEVMTADLFDTEDGRRAKEYVEAVVEAGGHTGLSVGFYDRSEPGARTTDGNPEFVEIELDEVSLTPRNAVPGADVVGVRDRDAAWRMFDALLAVLPPDEVRAHVEARLHGDAGQEQDTAEAGRTPDTDPDADPADSQPGDTPDHWMARRQALVDHYRQEFKRWKS